MGVERIELGVGRLKLRFRFTWAFHAREVRFERKSGAGFAPVFPETFSFHSERHDPTELQLQLEDLWGDVHRIGEGLGRREGEQLLRGLFAALPGYLERTLDRLEREGLDARAQPRVHADALLLIQLVEGFLAEKRLDAHPETRMAALHLRKLSWRLSGALLRSAGGAAPPTAPREAASSRGAAVPTLADAARLHAAVDRGEPAPRELLWRLAQSAFHRWLEEVCLDESNGAFEGEDSPFADRESEVLDAVAAVPGRPLQRTRDLSPFLSGSGDRDRLRLLTRLEVWFLRQYDIYHAAAVIHHKENLRRARVSPERTLSHHSSRNYALAMGVLSAPYLCAIFAYERFAPALDLICSVEIALLNAAALWFLLVRFCWRKDLTLFHTSVPRIGAGIIVGYLPVFLIDEVWDLARRPAFPLGVIVSLLGFTTLLYLYVEVHRRVGDPAEAFARARRVFLLGLLQSMLMGLLVTSLLGSFMVSRTWGAEERVPLAELRETIPPLLGEMPRILGVEPVVAFPSAVFLMTFLSFFIGTFLQLLWEDLPITEPLGARPSGVSGIQTGTFRASGGSEWPRS